MTRVDRTDQLLDALRQQLLEKIDKRSTGTNSLKSGEAAQSASIPYAESITDLKRRIKRELQNYDLSSPTGRRRARISFLESVLTWDFGDAVIRDPQFVALVKNIEETIGQNSSVSVQLDEMLVALTEASSG